MQPLPRRRRHAIGSADRRERPPGRGDRGARRFFQIRVENQNLCIEPGQRLAKPLGRLAHMHAAGDRAGKRGAKPRNSVTRRTLAEKRDDLTLAYTQ